MWEMIAGASLSVLGTMLDNKNQNAAWAAQETARRKQNLQAVRQANVMDANLRLQDKSNFDRYRQELETASIQSIKAQATVQTAMAESNLEGRSMDRVAQNVKNVASKTKGMLNENYERDYHNIYAERSSVRDGLIAQLEGSQPASRGTGGTLGQILGVANSAVQGAQVGQSLWGTIKELK